MQPHSRPASFERILSWPPQAPGSVLYANRAVQNDGFGTTTLPINNGLLPAAKLEAGPSKLRVTDRLITRWRVNRSDWLFTTFVVALQAVIGGLQCYKYSVNAEIHEALGWGVGIAKACAGALYPTMFFLILSMSRWTATLLRNSTYLSGVINFDKFRSFHIRMAICAFVLSLLHHMSFTGHIPAWQSTEIQDRGG